LPKAIQSSGEASTEKILKTTAEISEKTGSGRLFDADELNFVRKQFNALEKVK